MNGAFSFPKLMPFYGGSFQKIKQRKITTSLFVVLNIFN
jgi:hypothetical protein